MPGKVKIVKNGPYLVSGGLPLFKERAVLGKEGEPEFWVKDKDYPKQENYSLCRCGKTKKHPFCDGAHTKAKFNGTETASMQKFEEQATKIIGPGIDMLDAQELCSSARFCHLEGSTWANVRNSTNPHAIKIAQQTAFNCPAGRLVVYDKKTGKPLEPKFEQLISLIEDTPAKVSGPIWLKGGIELESSYGMNYETRNRCTVCRCGKSTNKPFCDGSHIRAGFNDGDESLK
jgi:CDGSH-type Zn-finger protein